MNKSNNSVEFFNNAAQGNYEPIKEAQKTVGLYNDEEYIYNLYKDKFDNHINASIPLYLDTQLATINSLGKMSKRHKNVTVLDIGSSNGTWGKTLAYLNQNITVHSLDPNDSMSIPENIHPINYKEIKQSFLYQCCDKEPYKVKNKYDAIKESMTFQFISNRRDELVKEVKKQLKDGGLFISEEKFKLDESDYKKNEELKDNFKLKHFKNEDVLKKRNSILGELSSNQIDYYEYIKILRQHFNYVKLYYKAGNFIGVVASDLEIAVYDFCKNITRELKQNKYNAKNLDVFFITSNKKINNIYKKIAHNTRHVLDASKIDTKDILFAITNKYNDCLFILTKDGEFKSLAKADCSLSTNWWKTAMDIGCNICDTLGIEAHLNCYNEPHLLAMNYKYNFSIVTTSKFDTSLAPRFWYHDRFLRTKPDVIYMKRYPTNKKENR